MPPANNDATTLGQLVILAGLVITALTQIALAFINRRETAASREALAVKVETTAAKLATETAERQRHTEDLVRRSSEEVRDAAERAYKEANSMNAKIASLTKDLDARFDRLLPRDR